MLTDPHTPDLHPPAPNAQQHLAHVVSQRSLASETFALRVHCPPLARAILPGQFFMIRPEGGSDPLLGRPFALYDTILDTSGEPTDVEFVYHVVGKVTGLMSGWNGGERVVLWGPLGNGFPMFGGRHLACVGGGIGYTPFLAVSRETLGGRQYGQESSRRQKSRSVEGSPRVTLCYGVQSKHLRADLTDFESLQGLKVLISTDDGSEGQAGYVTQVLERLLQLADAERPDGVYCCGPEIMMHAVARQCRDAGVACWLSLETPMACGFGACFSCVTQVRTEEGWDYRRTCVEGPIFESNSLWLPE